MKDQKTEEKLQIKVLLKGDSLQHFKIIKKKRGFQTNAETIRYLIGLEYEHILSRSE